MTDGRCRFGPRAKREMVARLLAGEKARAIARSMGCSPTTVTTARDRWLARTEAERAAGAWCAPRRPVPRSCPWALSGRQEQAILEARERRTGGRCGCTSLTGRHRSTIWKVLRAPRRLAPARARSARRRAAMSGPKPARCCISTPSSCPSSTGPGTGRTATAPSATDAPRRQDGGDRRHRRPHPPGLLRAARRRERGRPSRRRCGARRPGCASRAAAPSRR